MAATGSVAPVTGYEQRQPRLRGGRPCGQCGQLADADLGSFGHGGIFYCAMCWEARARALEAARSGCSEEVWNKGCELVRSKAEEALRRQLASGEAGGEDGMFSACLGLRPEISAQRGAHGRTLLHLAAETGDAQAVRALLDAFGDFYGRHVELGNAVELYEDGFGLTAGELAFARGHGEAFDALVDSACSRPRPSSFCGEHNKAYVKQQLKYEGDGTGRVLLDATGGGVMMGWEKPLMARHAELLAPVPGLTVLNVGFGLGLVDGFLQERLPSKHTIVEAHPDVHKEMARRGWPDQPGVVVLQGRWQDVVEGIVAAGPFDGIFFDTYAEMYGDLQEFFALLPRLLRPGGRFSFFNGLSDKNIYAQAISCRCAQADLARLGLACLFEPVTLGAVSDEEWRKVVNHYWSLETYYVPLAVRLPSDEDMAAGEAELDLRRTLPREGRPGQPALRASAVQVGDAVGKVLDEKLTRAQDAADAAATSRGCRSGL